MPRFASQADIIGASDPFCEVEFNGIVLGRTKTRENTLNPFWTNETFSLVFDAGKRNDIVVRVFDEDDNQKSEFLGMATFSSNNMENFGKFKANAKITRELEVDPTLSRDKNLLVQGTLCVTFVAPPQEPGDDEDDDVDVEDSATDEHANEDVSVEIHVISSGNLANADSYGSSDPIAILKFMGKEVGRTNVVKDNSSPIWKKTFNLTLKRWQKKKKLDISVYDMDLTGIGAFLGRTVVLGSELMFPTPTAVVKDLEQKPSLGKRGNKNVQGTIKYSIRRQLGASTARLWRLLRMQVTVAARQFCKEELIKDPHDTEKIVKLGLLCAASKQGGRSPRITRCAVLLLSHAIHKGHLGDGRFWRCLAECHFVTWMSEGLRAERLHLERSYDAYENALKSIENATDIDVWLDATYVCQLLGRPEQAAQMLNNVLMKFPNHKDSARRYLQAAILMSHLHRYKVALSYMENCVSGGGANPYTKSDLLFVMARIKEMWGKEEALRDKSDEAEKLYADLFAQMKKSGEIKAKDLEYWLGNPGTWKEYGDKCSAAGHFFFSANMYKEALTRLKDDKKKQAALQFSLSKARYRCGDVEKAVKELKIALSLDPGNLQLQHTLDAWVNAAPNFHDDMSLAIPVMLGVFLDGQDHPLKKDVALLNAKDSKSATSNVSKVELSSSAISLKSSWLKLRYHIQSAARQFYKAKVLDLGQADRGTIATLGCLCFDKSITAKPHLMRACAILLKRACIMWSEDSARLASLSESVPTQILKEDSGINVIGGCYGDSSTDLSTERKYSRNKFPHKKKLALSMFRTWLNDGMLGERQMLVESMHAAKEALQHIEWAADSEIWLQLARSQQSLGKNAAAVISYRHIRDWFAGDARLCAIAEINLAMIFMQLKKYHDSCNLLKECLSRAKQGLLPYSELDIMFLLSRLYELWGEAEGKKAILSQMGYQSVLERLQESGSEDMNLSCDEWLSSPSTWQMYAAKCENCGHFGFGQDLYHQSFKRSKEALSIHSFWYGVAKCSFMCGEYYNSSQALIKALELSPDSEEYSNALSHSKDPINVFEEEVSGPLSDILEVYLKSDNGAEVEIAKGLMRMEFSKLARPNWKLLKFSIRELARKQFATEEMLRMMEKTDGACIAKMGLLCYESSSSNFKLLYASCLLMQNGEDIGIGKCDKFDSARFYHCLAESHFKIWTLSGVRAKRINLILCAAAWDKALAYVENASDFEKWLKCASVHQYLGDMLRTAAVLGYVLKAFPRHQGLGCCMIRATSVLVKMEMWREAAAYMNTVMSFESVSIFSKMDLMFIMATIFKKWGQKENNSAKIAMADASYAKIYSNLVEEEAECVRECKSAAEYIETSATWVAAAETCMSAGVHFFACIFLEKGIDLCRGEAGTRNAWTGSVDDPKHTLRLGQLCYKQARCLMKIGEESEADIYLKEAISCGVTIGHKRRMNRSSRDLSERSEDISNFVAADENGVSNVSNEDENENDDNDVDSLLLKKARSSRDFIRDQHRDVHYILRCFASINIDLNACKKKSVGNEESKPTSLLGSLLVDAAAADEGEGNNGGESKEVERSTSLLDSLLVDAAANENLDRASMKISINRKSLKLADEAAKRRKKANQEDYKMVQKRKSVILGNIIFNANKSVDSASLSSYNKNFHRRTSIDITNPPNEETMRTDLMLALHETSLEIGKATAKQVELELAGFTESAVENFCDTLKGFVATNKFNKLTAAIGKLASVKKITTSSIQSSSLNIAPALLAEGGVAASPKKREDDNGDSTSAQLIKPATPGTKLQNLLNREANENKEKPRNLWLTLRKNIREAAREYYRLKLCDDPRNISMIVRMGFLCADSSPNSSLGTTRCSAVLLQRAANYGYEGDSRFWKTLALQHLKAYKQGGLRSERLHLVKARSAWDIAFTYIDVALEPSCHFAYAETTLHLGNHERTLKAYLGIIENFPKHKNINSVMLKTAMLRAAENDHERAIAILKDLLEKNVHAPYTKSDVMFLIARLYEQWNGLLENKSRAKQAKEYFARAYDAHVEESAAEVKEKSQEWLSSPFTYMNVAERASTAENFLFATDMYSQAARRLKNIPKIKSVVKKKVEAHNLMRKSMHAKLYFGLSKSFCKAGDMVQAIDAIGKGLTFDAANYQMLGLQESWENPAQRLDHDLNIPIESLLKNYLNSTLQNLNALPTPTPLRREVTFEICSCSDLQKADTFGMSDPFCIASFAGKEIHRTKVVKDSCNPTFANERMTFTLPDNLAGYSLVIEVYDEDSMGQGSFLGLLKLPAAALLDAPPPLEKVAMPLQANAELNAKQNKLVGGIIAIKWAVYNSVHSQSNALAHGGADDGIDIVDHERTTPRAVVRLSNLSCKNLGQADKFGLSDPFCIIKYGETEVGRTSVKENTLAPKWKNERFLFTLPSEEIKAGRENLGEFCIEVWDHDTVGEGEFLGEVKFGSNFYLHLAPGLKSYNLERKDGLPPSEQLCVQGKLECTMFLDGGDFGNLLDGADSDGVKKVEVNIMGAHDLAKADGFGRSSDPYAILKWSSLVVGKTEVVSNNLNPKWTKSKFEVTIIDDDDAAGDEGGDSQPAMVLEVWDHDNLGKGTFLGGAVVEEKDYLYPSGKKIEVELRALESVLGDLDDDKVKKRLEYVQGTLYFKLKQVEDPGIGGVGSHNANNEALDCWSTVGCVTDAEKFQMVNSKNRVEIERSQINQILSCRASGEKAATLRGRPEVVVSPVFDVGLNVCGRAVGPEMGSLKCLHIVRLPGYDWCEDVTFASLVAKETEKALRCIRGRELRKLERKNALLKVKQMCSNWSIIDALVLMKGVMGVLTDALPRTNIYFGMLQPGGASIVYSVVSPNSSMLGKELLRSSSPSGVSFSMIGRGAKDSVVCDVDEETGEAKLVREVQEGARRRYKTFSFLSDDVRGDEDEYGAMLPKMLGNRFKHGWPFLSVPLINGDCSIGVIGVDSWEFVGRGRQDGDTVEPGILEFLKKVGVETGTAVDRQRKLTFLSKLEEAVDSVFVTAEDIYIETLKVIASNVLTSTSAEVWSLREDWSLSVLASISCNAVENVGAIYDEGLALEVEYARKLGKADSWGESDPFCRVFWNEKRIGETKVVGNSCNPVWNESFILTPPPRGTEMKVRVEVWDADLGRDGDFLGEVTLDGKTLLRPPKEPMVMKLAAKDGLSKKANKLVKGKLCLSLKKAGGSDKFRDLKFTILDCHGLAKADFWGLSDPVVVLKWEGKEITRTSVVEDSLDPAWNEHFVVKVPELLNEATQFLTLEVYDQDVMGLGDFLGRVVIKGMAELLDPPSNKRVEYALESDPDKGSDGNKLVQGTMRLHYGNEEDIKPKYFREIVVEEARGLAKADLFGKSDPLVIVYYDDNEVFRTKSAKDTLDPLWLEDNKCVIGLPETVFEDKLLELKVWDEDVGGKLGDFLGMCTFTTRELMDCTKDDDNDGNCQGRRESDLAADDALGEKENALVKGTLTIRMREASARGADNGARVPIRVCVRSAANLAKADTFGGSDPYAVVEFAGRTVGKTRHISNTLNPTWNDSKFLVWLPPDVREDEYLKVKVFDRDVVGSHEFLGLVTIPGSHLLMSSELSNDAQAQAQAQAQWKMNHHTLRPDETATQKGYNKLVRGTLELGYKAENNDDNESNFDADGVARLREGEKGLRMNVLSASGLAKADTFGKSDPIVVVRVDGDGWYETAVVKDTMDPVWGNESTVFPLERKYKDSEAGGDGRGDGSTEGGVGKGKKTAGGSCSDSHNDGNRDSRGKAEGESAEKREDSKEEMKGEEKKDEEKNGNDGNCTDTESDDDVRLKMNGMEVAGHGDEKLILEVWDMDIAGKGDFLGRVSLSKDRIMDANLYDSPQTFALLPDPTLPESSNLMVKQGKKARRGQHETATPPHASSSGNFLWRLFSASAVLMAFF